MFSKALKRTAASLTCFFFTYSIMLPAWADVIQQSAADGNAAAVSAMTDFELPSFNSESGEILFGAGGQQTNIRAQDLFPGATDTQTTDLQNFFGDDEKTLQGGNVANQQLLTEQSMNGDAYRVLKGSVGMIRPNIKNDPLWSNTDTVIKNQDVFEKEFADCKENSEVTPTTITKHVPDYKTCERVNKPAGNCEINHTVEIESGPADLFFLVDNSSSMGEALATLRTNASRLAGLLGETNGGQLRLGGAITRGDKYLYNHTKLSDNVEAFQSWINSVNIDGGTTYTFPAVHWAVANNDWRENVAKVIIIIGNDDGGGGDSPAVMLAQQGFKVYIFHNNGEIRSIGEHISDTFTAGGLFKVAQFLTVVRDSWGPADCIQAANSTKDGFCTGTYTVTAGTTECVNLSGFDVCPGDPIYDKLSTPPISDVPKTAVRVSVGDVKCPFNEGKMECFVDSNGVEQCPENSDKVCAVTHTVNMREIPLEVKVAVEDTIEPNDNHQILVDFVEGTVKRTLLQQYSIVGSATKADYNYMCGRGSSGKQTPTKFVLSNIQLWDDHPYAPKTLPLANVSVTQAPSCENGLKAIINITDHAVGTPTWYFANKLQFKGVQLLNEAWGPDYCIAAANKIQKGQCPSGNLKVTKGVSEGCLTLSGVDVCPGDPFYESMLPSPIENIDKLALQVRTEGCIENGLRSSTCDDLEENPKCGFISQKCVGGAEGASGYCYVDEQVWDCGDDVEVGSATVSTSYQCDGPVRCMGTDCYNPVDEKSDDFAYAAAALQIAQFAENDLDCGDEQGSLDCKVWVGEHMECKKAVGGWVDCCEAPEGVSLMDYVNLTMNTLNVANKLGAFGPMAKQQGLWSYGADMVGQGWSSVMSSMPWSTAADAATAGSSQLASTTASAFIQGFQQSLMNAAAQWTANLFGPAAANTLFAAGTISQGPTMVNGQAASYASTTATGTTTTATNATLAPMVGAMLSVIMWAYMIYQIANILVNIIWECEEDEFMLGAKKETKVCHFVGSYCASESAFGCIEKRESYCCFNSPLGRIVHEQARPQMGPEWDWGDPEEPNCGGFTIEQIGEIDWSKIDISEWIGILDMTGHYPTINNISLDDLTGEGSILNVDGDRMNTLERNSERVKDMEIETIRKEAEDDLRSNVK